ncbi:MAG: glutathione S-transferase N-terminal domain-containing protein [SAR324 cluster bacterium]|nr:glutathione S-transferase N-terminal domain-containing protein [SAR324 cluster bacterium]
MIDLYSSPTPNGYKISIMLEEIGLDYKAHFINLMENQQKEDWFLQINPNGRIPAIIDHDLNDFKLFESGAILLYLAEKTGMLLPKKPSQKAECIQWLMFQMSAIGPMQGQAHVFKFAVPKKNDYAIKRYVNETERLYKILDLQLKDREFITGDYSIADIALWPWIRLHLKVGITLKDKPSLCRWLKQLALRQAFIQGIRIPHEREWPDFEI